MQYPEYFKKLEQNSNAQNYFYKTKLVIVEGLSTTLLEAIASDVPVICFWPKDTFILQNEFINYFDALIEADIVVNDPHRLASIVKEVSVNSRTWWNSTKTFNCRKKFQESNLQLLPRARESLLKLISQ